ncbi:MAG: PGF-pre-PGF domain-containing protein [Methanoregula sp.]
MNNTFKVLVTTCILAMLMLPGISSGEIQIGGNSYATLEDAVAAANPGDQLDLVSNTSVTLTPGNITAINKGLTIAQNAAGYTIFLNGTLTFNGTGVTCTYLFADPYPLFFEYDPNGPAIFQNNSLIEITGSSNTFTADQSHPRLNAGAFTNTGINIIGNYNSFNYVYETRTLNTPIITHLSPVTNLSGSYNSIVDSTTFFHNTDRGAGLYITGNFNGASGSPTTVENPPSLHLDLSDTTSAPLGRVNISPLASGNVIWDINTTSLPTVTIYNGTSAKSTTAWYFFNTSWAGQSGGNRNVTISVPQAIPLAGNVSLVASYANITGLSDDYVRTNSLATTAAGFTGGNIFNDTSTLKFSSISAVVPVRMDIGNNTYYRGGTRIDGTTLSAVTILNFNPYNSLPANNFNATATTNWSRIQDFTSAPNVTFVIEDPATRRPLGNISFNQNLNLLNSVLIGTGLPGMGSNISMSTTGNSTNLSVTTSGLSEFNKPATITVYPTGFTFYGKRDINITVTPDGSSSPTTLFDHNSWINRAGYVDNSANVTVGAGFISLPVLHFSRYDFSLTTNTSPITVSLGPGGDFSTLEEAVLSAGGARENDTLSLNLNSDIYVTKTAGNVTFIDKTLNLTSNGNKILVNGTIAFNGTGKTWTYTDAAWFSYNNPSGAPLQNNSLIQIPGSSQYFNGTMPTIDAGSFAGTGVNITGNSNTINAMWNISGSAMPIVVNLTGSSNTLNSAGNLSTTGANGIAINLLGNTNTISVNSQNLSAPGGRIWIGTAATGNTISDSGFTVPNIYIYNGTSVKTTTAWYFFNASWSPSGRNRNPVINVSQTIPLAGNVSLVGRFINITGQSTDLVRNTSLALTTTGLAGGTIFNDTSGLKFNSVSAIVPVNLTFGDNTYAGSYQQKGLGSVVVLNFNPVNSLPSKNFNATRTTNWSFVPDFTAVHNLSFVIEEPTAHTVLGNISYNQDLDLTDPAIGTALPALSSNLNMAAAGNSIDLNIANTHQAFNKPATLTVYPTGFTYSSGTDIKITATTDSGTSTVLYNNGVWLNRAGFVDTDSNVSVGSGNILLPVLHFSKYDFDQSSGSGSSSGDGGGGGGYSSAGAPSYGITKVIVGTKGGSAINMIEVNGTGVATIIISAIPHTVPPSSVPHPAPPVYQYIEVIPDHYAEINNAVITFSVQKSWFESNGYAKNDITILRLSDGVWTPVPTFIVGENTDFVQYQATTSGFSFFAIVYMKDAAMEVPTVPINVTGTLVPVTTLSGNVTETPVPVSAVTGEITKTGTPASPISKNPVPAQSTIENSPTQQTSGFTALIATAAIVVVFGGIWISSRKNYLYR